MTMAASAEEVRACDHAGSTPEGPVGRHPLLALRIAAARGNPVGKRTHAHTEELFKK